MFMPACFGAQFDSGTLQNTINDVLGIGARLFGTRLIGISRIEGTLCTVMAMIDQHRQLQAGKMLPLGHTFCALTLEQNDLLQINNTSTHSNVQSLASRALGMPLQAYLGVPLRVGAGRVFGSLWIAHNEPYQFTAHDCRMISLLARLLTYEIECATKQQHESRIEQMMATQAQIDPLTGLFSHDGFLQALAEEASWRQRFPHIYTIATIQLNVHTATEQYAADEIHQGFADILMRTARIVDYCGRIGSEEYAVMLPSMTINDNEEWQERLHAGIDAWNRMHSSVGLIFDVALGMADSHETPGWGQSVPTVLDRARQRMLAVHNVGQAA